MLVTLEGMTISNRESHLENALSPMLVTLEGMTISDRELHHENALSPMLATLEGRLSLTENYKKKMHYHILSLCPL